MDIGLVGKKSGWTVLAGGNAGIKPRLADVVAKGLTDDRAYDIAEDVIKFYKKLQASRKNG